MGINPCRIIPVISNNSASIWEQGNKKKKERLDYAISGELLGSFCYGIWDNFTGISTHFTATDHNERHARS